MNFYLRLLFIILFLFSCENQEKKYIAKIYSNGKIEKLFNSTSERPNNGQSLYFYETGSLKAVVYYKNNLEHGNAYYFYKSGSLKSFRHWFKGNLNGYVCDYYDDTVGIIKTIYLYDNNGNLAYRKFYDSLGNFIKKDSASNIHSNILR